MQVAEQDLVLANQMLEDVAGDMNRVFAAVGKSEDAVQSERLIEFVRKRGKVRYEEVYRFVHSYFPDAKDFEGIITGAMRAGFLQLENSGNDFWVSARER